MFLDKDRARALLYRVARQCFIDLQTAVGVAETLGCTACGSRATTGRRRGSVPTLLLWRPKR